jgi:predicted nucleic acid-binding protein
VATLVDTNILVYRCDSTDPAKREASRQILRAGGRQGSLCLPHQVLIEFVNAVTRGRAGGYSILPHDEAWRQAEDLLNEFPILYPNESIFRTAMRGMASYRIAWYDAHLWAYAEYYGIPEILSEDFEHGRWYGTVRVRNPFVELGLA